MLPNLCGLLIRFHLNAIALVADFDKAFLNIGLQQRDPIFVAEEYGY